VHQDGLVHVSQLAERFVKDPQDVVKVNQRVSVTVLEVDLARNRISLSMKTGGTQGEKKAESKKDGQPAKYDKKALKAPVKPKHMPFNNPFAKLL
jgi:protein Tex